MMFIQSDALILKRNCVTSSSNESESAGLLKYAYVGAPWHRPGKKAAKFRMGGNGGLSLRRKSLTLA